MNRRTYLAGVVGSMAGTAGCLDLGGQSNSVSDDPFSTYGCPPDGVDDVTGRPICSQTVDTDEADVYLLPSSERAADPSENTLTLTNESSEQIEYNPHNWSMWVEQAGEWQRVERTVDGGGYVELEPGRTYSWTLAEVAESIQGDTFSYNPGTYFASLAVRSLRPAGLFRITDE